MIAEGTESRDAQIENTILQMCAQTKANCGKTTSQNCLVVTTNLTVTIDIAPAASPREGEDAGTSVTVSDEGPGIPEEALAHLTEAFYRVDKARSRKNGGAGLGLTLCERIAEMHNGGLSFRSEPGKGTLVTARFAAGRGRPSGKGDDRND